MYECNFTTNLVKSNKKTKKNGQKSGTYLKARPIVSQFMSGLFLCMPQHLETALESTSLKMPFSLFVHLMALGQVSLSCNNLRRNSQRYVVVPSRDFRFIGMPSGPILGLRAFFFNCKNKIEGKLVFIHFLGLRAFFFNCKNKREGK